MKQFLEIKKDILGRKDKSDIGSWDKHILSLCEKINSKEKYYTTSSCAGRIVLIIDDKKKKSGLFLFRTHEKILFNQFKQEISKIPGKTSKLIYFKQEPCILHVACIDLQNAQKLLDSAKLCGWKNSGIMNSRGKIILEMRSTEKLEFPIINKGKLLVDYNFLRILVKEANRKLERVWGKIAKQDAGKIPEERRAIVLDEREDFEIHRDSDVAKFFFQDVRRRYFDRFVPGNVIACRQIPSRHVDVTTGTVVDYVWFGDRVNNSKISFDNLLWYQWFLGVRED